MNKQKKLVIKVNYEGSEKPLTDENLNQEMANEWDIKRIVIVLLLLLFLLAAGIYYIFNKSSSPILNTSVDNEITSGEKKVFDSQRIDSLEQGRAEISEQAVLDEIGVEKNDEQEFKTIIDEESQKGLVAVQSIYSKQVVRSQLTNRVTNNEPADLISSPILVEKDNIRRLYYFTELKDMSGNTIYHNWIYKGESVFRKKFNINGSRWRVTTQKKLNNTLLGDWKVTLTDSEGYLLDEITFKVIIQ